MNNEEIELVAKPVKDMYGTSMGTVLGTITDIDGSIQTVGVDCGSAGLRQIPYEQLVVQDDAVIFIPRWRLDSQRLIREKGLALRRLKALMDIVSENDDMREDAETIHEKYKAKLVSLDERERDIRADLDERLTELNIQLKAAKTVQFDAKVQYKSNEIAEPTFELVTRQANSMIEHITHETAEIVNVQRRIADLDMEIKGASEPPQLQDSAATYLANEPGVETSLPEAPTTQPVPEPQRMAGPETVQAPPLPPRQQPPAAAVAAVAAAKAPHGAVTAGEDADWLSRMEAQ